MELSNIQYDNTFLYNDKTKKTKVLSTIKSNLNNCDEFIFSVAFITMSGIMPLLNIFKELENKGIKGKILTTNYLLFSDPKAIKILDEFNNIEVKMYMANDNGFHTKGYIFKKDKSCNIIIGSSNLTGNAMCVNEEWNSCITSSIDSSFAIDILNRFDSLWNNDHSMLVNSIIEKYELDYLENKKKNIKQEKQININVLTPNQMQKEFINNLQELIDKGENRALLLSATGTGKTYASAFAARELNPKRILFVVHREQIARQAMNSYKRVFGNTVSMGLLSGNSKESDKDFVFSTVQTLSKDSYLNEFSKDAFDIVIVDEVHKAGSNSYIKLLDYFTPKLFLGMTASPERTDGFDIFKLFDHNIAADIRLQRALEEDLVCPFHYFGITDFEYEGKSIDDESGLKDFSLLVSYERVRYIVDKSNYYGYSGDRVKGLVFCSNRKEALELSEKFNELGYNTVSLNGDDSQSIRDEAIERLVGDIENKLDYIFTVDIFNEGVDIPEVNQVIMLRPTQSPVVFVQQLGRGLRKYNNKEYVVIIDFIGNYTNNFMIPIALSGDRTYNKDNIRKYVLEGDRVISGLSSIQFDEISKKRIFNSIDSAKFSDLKIIKESYTNLKNKLGRIPSLLDFEYYGELDVCRIFDNKKYGSYYKFLSDFEKEYTIELNDLETKFVEFISKKIANGKRVHELVLLECLLSNSKEVIHDFRLVMKENYNIEVNGTVINNLVNIMTNNFMTGSSKDTYKECVFMELLNDKYTISKQFKDLLTNSIFRSLLDELLEYGLYKYDNNYNDSYLDSSLNLYKKYTYDDVCRLLNWDKSEVALNIGGYKYDKLTNTFPIFINYHKEDNISETIKYEDRFIANDKLIAISKQGRSIISDEVQNFINAVDRNINVELFVRKNKDDKESKEFYYLGRVYATGNVNEFIMVNTNKSAVEIEWKLDIPVREDIFDYITNE